MKPDPAQAAERPVTIEELRAVPTFEGLSEEELCWFLDHAERRSFAKGEMVFQEGDPIDYFLVLLEGKLQVQIRIAGQLMPVAAHAPGAVTGALPYSRLYNTKGRGFALEDTFLLCLHRSRFAEMGEVSPELVARLVDHMKDRVRDEERRVAQQSKLRALAKLSAGLAHELNNPASAIRRSAQDLSSRIAGLSERAARLATLGLEEAQMARLKAVAAEAPGFTPGSELSAMQRAEREDRLADLLEAKGADDPFALAESFCSVGLEPERLAELCEGLPEKALPAAFDWLEATLAAGQLAKEAEAGAGRISALLASLKSYSQMDTSQGMAPVDLKESVGSTLEVLRHRFERQGVDLELRFEEGMPKAKAVLADLNQVWTALIENALDALEGRTDGKVVITGKRVGELATVAIRDNGPGVPEEAQTQVYEPFFTTKGVGRTGLGLDMASRVVRVHDGAICLESKPGQTVFRVDLNAID